MAYRFWKLFESAQWFATHVESVCPTGSRLTVDVGTFAVIAKDAGLILHPFLVQEFPVQHDAPLTRRRKNVRDAGFKREVKAILGEIRFQAKRHLKLSDLYLHHPVEVDVH